MNGVVLEPNEKIRKSAELLEEAVGRFLRARSTFRDFGRFESSIESLNLMYLLIRNVEGCVELARKDLVLLPAAMTLARSAYEIGFKIKWMLDPVDPFEREARWLAHMKSEVEFYDKLIAKYSKLDEEASDLWNFRETIESFRLAVSDKLPGSVSRVSKTPDLFSMMKSLDDERKYLGYIVLSQFAHGSHNATGLYRKNLGTDKSLGEFVEASTWSIPLSGCWYALHSSGSKLLQRLGGDPQTFIDASFGKLVQESIDAI